MKIKLIIRWSFITISITLMIIIFCFSAQDGKQSSSVSQNVSQNVAMAMGSAQSSNTGSFILSYIRKFAHVFLYAGLGLSVSVCVFTFQFKHKGLWVVIPVIICLLYASSDEFHQLFVTGREGKFTDVLIDSIGFLTTIVLSNLVWFFICGYKNKRNGCLQNTYR